MIVSSSRILNIPKEFFVGLRNVIKKKKQKKNAKLIFFSFNPSLN